MVALLLPPTLVWIALFALYSVVSWLCVHLLIWIWWCARGRDVLLIYSDSPIWREHIEERILPLLGKRVIVLNWSARRQWSLSLSRIAFGYFGGTREFNPLAVVFRPLRRTRTFRFWKAFRDMKHERPEALQAMEREFFGCVGISWKSADPTSPAGSG